MQSTKTIMGFITSVVKGGLAAVAAAFNRSNIPGRKIKPLSPSHPVTKSFGDYKDHIVVERSDNVRNMDEFENSAKVKMRSIKDDFETVFGIHFP